MFHYPQPGLRGGRPDPGEAAARRGQHRLRQRELGAGLQVELGETFANCRLTALLQGRPAVHRVAAPEQLHAGDLLAHGVADQDQDSHLPLRLPTAGQ